MMQSNKPQFFISTNETLDGFIINAFKNGNTFDQVVKAFTDYIKFVYSNEQTKELKLSTHISNMENQNNQDRKTGGGKNE